MDVKVIIDHKAIVALGVIAVGTIFAVKMDSASIKEVSIYAIDIAKELVAAKNSWY